VRDGGAPPARTDAARTEPHRPDHDLVKIPLQQAALWRRQLPVYPPERGAWSDSHRWGGLGAADGAASSMLQTDT
jgi:hypothetical protein